MHSSISQASGNGAPISAVCKVQPFQHKLQLIERLSNSEPKAWKQTSWIHASDVFLWIILATLIFSEEHVAIGKPPQDANLFNGNGKSNDYDGSCTWESWEEEVINYDPVERRFGELFVHASCRRNEQFDTISAEPLLPSFGDIEMYRLSNQNLESLKSW